MLYAEKSGTPYVYSERLTSRNVSGSGTIRRVLNSHSRSRRREPLSLRTDSARCEGASIEVLGSWSISRSSTESVISSSGCDRAMDALDVQRLHGIEPADALEQLLLFLRIRELLAGLH